jgi:hypothetical protein
MGNRQDMHFAGKYFVNHDIRKSLENDATNILDP